MAPEALLLQWGTRTAFVRVRCDKTRMVALSLDSRAQDAQGRPVRQHDTCSGQSVHVLPLIGGGAWFTGADPSRMANAGWCGRLRPQGIQAFRRRQNFYCADLDGPCVDEAGRRTDGEPAYVEDPKPTDEELWALLHSIARKRNSCQSSQWVRNMPFEKPIRWRRSAPAAA